jgi:uncharacterized protein YggE
MTRVPIVAIFAFFLFSPQFVLAQAQTEAQSQNFQDHVITVSRGGEAYAKPDLGILVMSIRSSAPIAEEAVAENARKAKAVESGLAQLGFVPAGYKITSVTFDQAGGPRYGVRQPEITAYEATQSVYVFFEGADLNDVAKLTEKTAAVIEALRKAGAVPGNGGGAGLPMAQGALIIYTIKDSAQYEKQALQQAIGRARDAAQDIATGTGVQITGLRNVKSSFLYGNYAPRAGQNTLDGLNYRWYSTKNDEVEIGANATVDYNFK